MLLLPLGDGIMMGLVQVAKHCFPLKNIIFRNCIPGAWSLQMLLFNTLFLCELSYIIWRHQGQHILFLFFSPKEKQEMN